MELLTQYGYSLVFSAILLEQLGFPIPAGPVLILAGALAAGGELSFSLILVFAALGSLIGDSVWYFVGKIKGRRILTLLCRISLSPDSCVRKTETSFMKYGMNSLLFAKFVPGLNTIAPPMAGMIQAGFLSFLWRDLIGTVAYSLAFILPGFFFEKAVYDLIAFLENIGRTFFWVLIGGFALYVLYKYLRLRILQRQLVKVRITPQEVHEIMNSGEPFIIVDLRNHSPGANIESLPGAIRIPPDEIDRHTQLLDKDKLIIMYCT